MASALQYQLGRAKRAGRQCQEIGDTRLWQAQCQQKITPPGFEQIVRQALGRSTPFGQAGALAGNVNDPTGRHVPGLKTGLARAPAELGFFVVKKEALVEAANPLQHGVIVARADAQVAGDDLALAFLWQNPGEVPSAFLASKPLPPQRQRMGQGRGVWLL